MYILFRYPKENPSGGAFDIELTSNNLEDCKREINCHYDPFSNEHEDYFTYHIYCTETLTIIYG